MCYVEASYYIHCAHLNVHFWTCDDLEHGHLRPKSVMHSFHRLCPACFKDKYVRPEGEGADTGESLGTVVDHDSEDGLEAFPATRTPTTTTPRHRHVSMRPAGTSGPSEPPALAQWFHPPDPNDPRSVRRTDYLNALSLSVGLNPTETTLMQGTWDDKSDGLLQAAAVRGIQLRSVVSWNGTLDREVRDGRTSPRPALMREFQDSETSLRVARQHMLAALQRLLRARLVEHRRAVGEADNSAELEAPAAAAAAAAAGEIVRWRGREEQEAMEEVEVFRRQLSPTRSRSRDALRTLTRDTVRLARSVRSLRDGETAPGLSPASGISTHQPSRAGAEEILTAGEESAYTGEAGEARDDRTRPTRTQHLRDAQEAVLLTVGTAHSQAQELEERRDVEVVSPQRGGTHERETDQGNLAAEPSYFNAITDLLRDRDLRPDTEGNMRVIDLVSVLHEDAQEHRRRREPHPWDPGEETERAQQAAEAQPARVRQLRAQGALMRRSLGMSPHQPRGQDSQESLEIGNREQVAETWIDLMRRYLREVPSNLVSDLFRQEQEELLQEYEQGRLAPADLANVNPPLPAEQAEEDRYVGREARRRTHDFLRRRHESPNTRVAGVVRQEREDHQLVQEQRIRARVLAGSRQRTQIPLQAGQTDEELRTSLQGPRRFRRRYHQVIDQRGTQQTQQTTSPASTASRNLQVDGEIVREGAIASTPEQQDGWEEERATSRNENLSETGVNSGDEMVVEEFTHSSDHGIAPSQAQDTNDHSGGPSDAPHRALVPRPASRSSNRSLRWTAFETQERPKRSKICSERNCKNGSDHHDDAKSLSTARQFQHGADATLDDLDNDTATYLVTFGGCQHKNVIMLERPAQSSPTELSAKCGCQIPISVLRATNLLVNRTAESRQKCLCCNRRNLRLRHFSLGARRIEDSELGTWQDEVG